VNESKRNRDTINIVNKINNFIEKDIEFKQKLIIYSLIDIDYDGNNLLSFGIYFFEKKR
jgi:hypothetical protein